MNLLFSTLILDDVSGNFVSNWLQMRGIRLTSGRKFDLSHQLLFGNVITLLRGGSDSNKVLFLQDLWRLLCVRTKKKRSFSSFTKITYLDKSNQMIWFATLKALSLSVCHKVQIVLGSQLIFFFEHTSACEERVYTIARTSGRLCEPATPVSVENLTHFTATWMCSINYKNTYKKDTLVKKGTRLFF